MSQKQQQSELDKEPTCEILKAWIMEGATNAFLANQFGTSKDSIRRFRVRHDLGTPAGRPEKAGISVTGDDAVLVTAPVKTYLKMDDPDAMLRERGLDPLEWYIDGATVNEWDGPAGGGDVITYHQAKLHLKRIKSHVPLMAARSEGWVTPPKRRPSAHKVRTVVLMSDQHAPFHDKVLHELACNWLEVNQPDEGIFLGDTADFSGDVSRHNFDPENNAVINECVQASYDLARGYVDASTGTRWKKLPGNHDERIRNYIIKNARPIYGLQRASPNGKGRTAVHGLDHLLRLDELGIEFVDPQGPYENGMVTLSPHLAAVHGWIATKGSGASGLKTLESLGYSVAIGHCHRQSIVHRTKHDINGKPIILVAVEVGCMCRIDGQAGADDSRLFPSYTVSPDWQQGFAVATIHPNGQFKMDLATYFDGTLLYRDQRYTI